jgi:flagellar basal-body rod protein FlgB
MANLFDKTFDVLDRSLDLHMLRHQVIADNIANAETPGFKAHRVDFEAELQRAVDNETSGAGTQRDIASVQANVFEDPKSARGQDLNTVDMDREMAAMTKNDIQYSAAAQSISKRFALLKYAITEGGER